MEELLKLINQKENPHFESRKEENFLGKKGEKKDNDEKKRRAYKQSYFSTRI